MQRGSDNLTARAASALTANLDRVAATGAHSWSFAVPAAPDWEGCAWLTNGWLSLRAAPQRRDFVAAHDEYCRWMEWNRRLPGGAKIGMHDHNTIAVGAETPVGSESDLGPVVQDMTHGLGMAVAVLNARKLVEKEPLVSPPASASLIEEVSKTCAQAGWQCAKRDNGQLAVPLELSDDFCQAQAIIRREREVSFIADILALDARSKLASCLEAVDVLLLRASARTPMVRAIAQTNGKVTFGAESFVVGPFSQEHIHHALCALSTFCQHTRKEVKALHEDQGIAEAYLEIHGWVKRQK